MPGFNFHSREDVFSREFHELKKEHSGLCDCRNLAESTKKTLYDDLKNFQKSF